MYLVISVFWVPPAVCLALVKQAWVRVLLVFSFSNGTALVSTSRGRKYVPNFT